MAEIMDNVEEIDTDKPSVADDICKLIDDNIAFYPKEADDPNKDRYYRAPLYLTKSELLYIKDALNTVKTSN